MYKVCISRVNLSGWIQHLENAKKKKYGSNSAIEGPK